MQTRSSATAETAQDMDDVNRPFKVTQGHPLLCKQRGIYDFLLTLNSNLAYIFNRSWDITTSLHIHTPPLYQVEPEKNSWE